MGYLIATAFWIFTIWLIRKDTASREGISATLWIPTIWVWVLLSRPLSMWIGAGGGVDSLEGSPMDRLFYFAMIGASIAVLVRRNVNWGHFIQENWPIFLLYGFFLVSVLWADSPVSSFKRWFKDLGNVFVAAVILTERNPLQAVRAVFIRCAYILFPLSIIFIRWFPDLGRFYTRSGGMQVVGVTTQKNSLGILVVVCGLILIWDWLEHSRSSGYTKGKLERYMPIALLVIGAYLLRMSDSQTSILCMTMGAIILLSPRFPLLRDRIGALGVYSLFTVGAYLALDAAFGVKEMLLGAMGRDTSFTGRTDVWRELLALKTDPLIGTGFLSFWSDISYQSRLPVWVSKSAHNGYLESYIDGGYLAISFLAVLLLVAGVSIHKQLATKEFFPLVRFSVLWVTLIGNFSESHFGRMTPLWFLFLLTTLTISESPHAPNLGASSCDGGALPEKVTVDRPSLSWLPSGR